MDKDFYIQLIHKQLTGEISSEENALLETYIQDNPEAAALVEKIELTWQLSQPESSIPVVDSEAELRITKHKLGLDKPATKVVPLRRNFLRIAAAALVLITASMFLIRNGGFMPPETINLLAVEETKEVTLPDGSKVWLQKGSALQYTAAFAQRQREIALTGTAFFDVERNESLPFQITAGEAQVTVLGTSFQVIQEVNSTAVHVYTGRVSLSANDEESILTINESTIYNNDNKTITEIPHQEENDLIWKTGRFVFRNITLQEALNQIEAFNQDKIAVENIALLQCRVNAVIQSTTTESVLNRLSESLETDVDKTDDHTYVLKGGKCP